MLYRALRRVARIALRWYYADLVVQGREQLPRDGPILLVANHPNALVDAMTIAVAVPRRVLLTAKATLFEQPVLAILLRAVGVVPLRRAKDESAREVGAAPSAARNVDAFQMVTASLAAGSAVLIFPEGISHDAPALAPLRTGAARMALLARASGVTRLRIIAVGLVYEEKERPRSRVLVRIGEPLDVDAWLGAGDDQAAALTVEIDARLRRVTLNFASEVRARHAVQLARTLDAIASEGVPPLDHPRALAPEAELARRIEIATDALAAAPESVVRQADAFISAAESFVGRLAERGVSVSELQLSPRTRHGAWFALRESLLLVLALPVALIDRFAHDLPVRFARALAQRSLAHDPSRDQPAMRMILLGAVALVAWYGILGIMLGHWLGARVALVALVTMALSAGAEPALRDRVSRAWRRARTYLALRADPALRASALTEANALLAHAQAVERALIDEALDSRPVPVTH